MIAVSDLPGAHRAPFRWRLLAPRHWPSWMAAAVLRLSLYLPLGVRAGIARGLGGLYYRGNAKRRRIAAINIGLCFPDWSAQRQARAVREHFDLAAFALFHMAIYWWAPERMLDRCLRVVGLEHYEAARAAGRPIIVLHCHCVALEAGLVLSRYFPYVGFMKPLKDPVFDFVMTRGRERFGGRVFARESGMRPLIRAVKAGFGAAYVPDEDMGPKESVYAPFFGVPAATLPTLGRLARLTDAAIIPCFARLLPDGTSELWLEPPLAGFPTASAVGDATAMNAAIERAVLKMPEQYLWTMKRFKTRDGAGSLYD
ncbi:lysophospholipid acyltransferase family protein [Acidiferrobacter sp.]|uniref:lysophospholipid acyltransferase family protein n=1 Tax=Acidiferrobacter sp. TaxID=1872107 RepID=UPI002612A303|nr:lysophospholipid acyltransferase family protein [Acidiferrobacter sp.]